MDSLIDGSGLATTDDRSSEHNVAIGSEVVTGWYSSEPDKR